MKRMTMVVIGFILAFLSLLAIIAVVDRFFSSKYFNVAYIIWFVFVVTISRYNNRQRVTHLTQMWALADQLGYGPADLKQREPRYGGIDWQLSRPEKLQFYPSDTTVKQLTKQFETELALRNNQPDVKSE